MTVKVRLLIRTAASRLKKEQKRKTKKIWRIIRLLDTLTILVVEDNEELKAFLKNILSENYTVITASNGKEGLQHAVDNIPDLIISDVMMPVMDGLEMIRQIKENNNICHIPIIVLSAKASLWTGLPDWSKV